MEVNMISMTKASLVAAFLGLSVTAVAAQPYVPRPAVMQFTSDNVLQADYKKYKKREHMRHDKWAYSQKYGNRYRHKRHGYGYFHEGWWYARPYWEPGVTIRLGL
jgi:hypothetical protein